MKKLQNLPLYGVVFAILFFLVFPIIVVVIMSFSDSRFLTFPPKVFSLRWYESYFLDPAWMRATRNSFVLAILTTILVVPVGTAAAYGAHMCKMAIMRHMQLLLLSPVIVPVIIIAAGLYMVYAQVGLLATKLGLVLAFATMNLPYVFISVLAGLRSYDMAQEDVARSLGVSRLAAFMKVTLPQIRPSVMTGALFAFIGALDETVISIFIAGGENQTLPSRMFMSLNDEIDPTIASISTVLISVSFALVILMSLRSPKKANG
ncbi:ABC transporter permease subunit [Pseudooceanicola sp. 216_PA32_1]|uniref:ABC transporter permease subunit n=1 Tax=Pseudooceanicola pacificus TaxID=2676438 RepID=A0A844W0M5_9RHOB|nr:ABC transporter permease [Pseudooceanicola pacificus]MWB77626.1 ABC transporter permease subunit [Pseudooceanicola pacificus]